jgi:hypothetical protein
MKDDNAAPSTPRKKQKMISLSSTTPKSRRQKLPTTPTSKRFVCNPRCLDLPKLILSAFAALLSRSRWNLLLLVLEYSHHRTLPPLHTAKPVLYCMSPVSHLHFLAEPQNLRQCSPILVLLSRRGLAPVSIYRVHRELGKRPPFER